MMLFLRSLTFHIYFYIVTIYIILVHIIRVLYQSNHAHYVYYRWGCLIAWGLKHICQISIEVRGGDYIPSAEALFASKHQSVMETALIFIFLDRPAVILKKELSYFPLVKHIIRGAGHICVDRKAGAKARQHIVDETKDRLSKGQKVLIFPEGTRSAVNAAPRYKRGIFSIYHNTETACTPIALNTGLFWPRQGFLLSSGTAIFEFLPPIETGLSENDFMTTLTTRIESTVARLVQEGVAEQSAIRRKTHPKFKKH